MPKRQKQKMPNKRKHDAIEASDREDGAENTTTAAPTVPTVPAASTAPTASSNNNAFDKEILPNFEYLITREQLIQIRTDPEHFNYSSLRINTPSTTNQSSHITLKRDDFLSLMEQLIKNQTENYLREQRIVLLENVLVWCFNFITFFQTFSSLLFFNKLPVSAAIFSIDMFNVPFDMINYISLKMRSLRSDLSTLFRKFYWTTNGTIIKSEYRADEELTFMRNEEEDNFTGKISRIRAQYEAFNRMWHADELKVAQSFIDLLPKGFSQQKEFANDLTEVCKKYNIVDQGFSPRYLVKQVKVSSMLSLFASQIFHYLPHLKVDMLVESTIEPSIQLYMAQLEKFWKTQINVSIGPFHMKYASRNFFRDNLSNNKADIVLTQYYKRLFKNTIRRDDDDDDDADTTSVLKISPETEQILSQLTFTRANFTSRLGFEVKLSNAWRTIFNTTTTSPELMETSDLDLFKTFMRFAENNQDNLFNQKLFLQFDRIFAGDVLANITFNFIEQNTILKLVIIQLIVRLFLNPASSFTQNTMNLHDPLVMLRDKINCCN